MIPYKTTINHINRIHPLFTIAIEHGHRNSGFTELENGDFSSFFVCLPEGKSTINHENHNLIHKSATQSHV